MAVQLAHIAGADRVIGVDPIEARRVVATALGTDAVLDPLADGGDAGMAIRRISGAARSEGELPDGARVLGGYREVPTQFGQRGVDVAIEASGSIPAVSGSATSSTSTASNSSPPAWRACPYATPPHGRWSGWWRWP
jgi:threonine dehydrogenase-like Zn-dependent dehydrogenase